MRDRLRGVLLRLRKRVRQAVGALAEGLSQPGYLLFKRQLAVQYIQASADGQSRLLLIFLLLLFFGLLLLEDFGCALHASRVRVHPHTALLSGHLYILLRVWLRGVLRLCP